MKLALERENDVFSFSFLQLNVEIEGLGSGYL